jgi:hypothetical protein
MLGPSQGLTHEETTAFIAELKQRWREAMGEEKERLTWALFIWLRMVTRSDHAASMNGCEQPSEAVDRV